VRPPASARASRPLRLVVTDFLMAALAVWVAYQVRYHVYPSYIPGGVPPDPRIYALSAPVVAVTLVVVFALLGRYRLRRGITFVDELFALGGAMAVVFLVVLAEIGLIRIGALTFSRLTTLYWAVAAGCLIAGARYAIRRYEGWLRSRGVGVDRALMVGWGTAADLLVQRLRMFPEYGYQVVGVIADGLEPGSEVAGFPVVGEIGEIERVLYACPVDTVFFALPDADTSEVLDLVERCRRRGVDVRILPSGLLDLVASRVTGDQIDGIPVLRLRHGLEISGPKTAIKRWIDIVVGGLALVLLSPLMGVLALAVRLTSRGPVLIHQERVGMHGRTFMAHKFRSMRVDAEVETGPVWASADDPRRTAIGRVLRRLSLDELPQLWNVVKGEMSLVGPRPERPAFVEEFQRRLPRYCERHLVRPGLTGWAQANDLRGRTPLEERLAYDLYYIENWNPVFDLKIMLITAARVWTHKNAY
jgi:exopolysaccharide biosynthesis polyprenyl glycosylphosphotransferase